IHGGRPYFELLEALVEGARQQIFFQTYIFDAGTTGVRVAAALSRAASRGVQVYILLDGYASQSLPDEIIQHWREAGIHFRWFEPLLRSKYFYFGRRLHHKVLVVDGAHGLVGGINISDRYNDLPDHPAWLDWAVHVRGEVVSDLHALCARRAVSGKRLSLKKKKLPPMPTVDPQSFPLACRARIRINDWVRGKREITRCFHDMLRQAQSEVILMSSYFMPGRDFKRQLRLALKRGVRVKVVLAGSSDVKLGKLAERYLYPWLLRHHAEIYEYQKSVLHAKIATCDGQWATVGSYNLNELSAKASVELNVEILNQPFALEVQSVLTEIIQNNCIRITANSDKHSGWFNRLVQLMAYQLYRLLLFLFTFYFRQHKQ
ncbi:MAG TPA: phospholipase D-like domain-containing protein, partial [Cyclobacteriaceae bacterium]|nr:phospholipase D-like domain-containing protein [Cyclobacteriaceae bacterium]